MECECETVDKPVNFLGDSGCKNPAAHVREIIKKYEPDRELVKQTSSVGSVPSTQRSQMKSLSHFVIEETGTNPMRDIAQQSVTKKVSTKSVEKQRGVGSKRSLGALSKKSNTSSIHGPKRSHLDMPSSSPLKSENTYKSKTTIVRTAQGVRITTDILFNSACNIPDQWAGRRIDTDLPHSKILLDFELKNSLSK